MKRKAVIITAVVMGAMLCTALSGIAASGAESAGAADSENRTEAEQENAGEILGYSLTGRLPEDMQAVQDIEIVPMDRKLVAETVEFRNMTDKSFPETRELEYVFPDGTAGAVEGRLLRVEPAGPGEQRPFSIEIKYVGEDYYAGAMLGKTVIPLSGDAPSYRGLEKEILSCLGLENCVITGSKWTSDYYYDAALGSMARTGRYIGCRNTENYLAYYEELPPDRGTPKMYAIRVKKDQSAPGADAETSRPGYFPFDWAGLIGGAGLLISLMILFMNKRNESREAA